MKNNTVIVAFGRMNPPTIGHLKLINKLKSLADEKSDVKARLYLSHSHDDKKNPLTYEEKIDFATVAFGDKVDVMESDAKTIYSVLAELYREGFENVVYVCGEDRFDEFQGIKEYNGKKTTKIGRPIRDDLYYEFDSIEIENAGHRDDNSENPEEKASASYVRKLAVEGDFITFSEYVPFDNRTAMNLFKLLRKRLASLDEAFVKRPNTHQTHFEDLVLLGPDGIAEIEDKIDKFLNNKDGLNMTSKIDGAPAVICYSKFTGYPDNSICLKSFVANANNVLSSEEDIMKKYGDRPSMAEKLVACLELAKLIPAGEAWQGDCLFSSDDKDIEEIRGKEYITFQPNKIVYAFSEENPGYENVKNADFGIAFHTVYKDDGNGGKSQSFRPAIESINWPEWVYVMSPALSLDNNSFNNDKIQKFADYFKENAEALAKMSSYKDIVNNEAFMSFWNTFENNYIADKKNETINCDTVIRELREYIAEKQTAQFQKKFSSLKTAKGKMKSIDEWSDSVAELKEIIHYNKDAIIKMVEVLNIAITIKMLMWHGFKNSKQDYSTFYKSRSRGVIDANMEGVAMSDMDGNIVKIVDRTEFSSANRDSDILAGWEHPHDKVQESLNLFDRILSLKEACFSKADIEKVSDGYMDAVLDDILNADSIRLGPNGEEKDSVDLNELRSDFGENLDIEVNKIYDLKDDTGKYPIEKTKKLFDSIFGKYFTWTDIFKGKYSGYDESKMATDIQESIQGIFLAINMLGLSETITDDMIFDSKNEIYHGKINGINCVKLDKIDLNNYKTQMKKLKNILYIDLPEELKSLDKNFTIVQPDGLSDNHIDKNIVKKLFATGFKFKSSSNVSLDKDTFAPADIYVINLNKLDELKSQIDSLGKEIEASKFVELTNTLFNEKIAIPISLKMSSNPSFYRIINTDASTLSYFGLDDIKEIFFNPTGNSRIVLSYNDHNENKEAILEFRRKGSSATSWQCNANIKGNSDAYAGGSVKTYMKITFESDMEGTINKNELNKILSYPKFAEKIKGKPICALGKGASSESSQFGNVGLGMTCKELMNHEKTSKIKINGETKNYDDSFTYIIQHAFKKAPDIQNTLKIM